MLLLRHGPVAALRRARPRQCHRGRCPRWHHVPRTPRLAASAASQFSSASASSSSSPSTTSSANMGRRAYQKKHFQDIVKIQVRGGNGGLGCNSFNVVSARKRRPDGGNGGRGGDVVIQCREALAGGLHVQKRTFGARNGANGTSQQMHGGRGADAVVVVPRGTIVYRYVLQEEDEGLEGLVEPHEFELLADLDEDGQRVVVAAGGGGAEGNAFAPRVTQRRVHEKQPHNYGELGEAALVVLELKTIADVGLVGFPNAGKSTLLGSLSRARPKVAPYPFTTVQPMVGHVEYADHMSLTLADIPGLIDGASENRGLGHEFLRHVQRTKVLCFVIDAAASAHEASTATAERNNPAHLTTASAASGDGTAAAPPPAAALPTPAEVVAQYLILDDELRLYDADLAFRPRLVVLNQVDRLLDAYADQGLLDIDGDAGDDAERQLVQSFVDALGAVTDAPVLPASARNGEGLPRVAEVLRHEVERQQQVVVGRHADEGSTSGRGAHASERL